MLRLIEYANLFAKLGMGFLRSLQQEGVKSTIVTATLDDSYHCVAIMLFLHHLSLHCRSHHHKFDAISLYACAQPSSLI